VKEGIHDLERMIVRAKGYRMVIDWKLAYDEIKQIADNMRAAMNRKTPKPPKQGDKQQLCSRCSKKKKINGKYWSSYVQWRTLLLLTP